MLRSEIFSGAFEDGMLPSESELMLKHEARRAAVRRALAMLRDEGVVERVQGIGTFVVRERYIAHMEELHGDAKDGGWLIPQVRSRVLDCSFTRASDLVARKLGLEPGDRVLRLDYVGVVDREPMALATNYVALPEAAAIADTPFNCDWYTLLHDAGVPIGRTEWVLASINADSIVAEHLDVAPGTALMLGEEVIWDKHQRPYDFAVCYMRTDRYAFSSQSWSIGSRAGQDPLVSSEEHVAMSTADARFIASAS